MLSKTQVVATRKAIEKSYVGTCDIVEYVKLKENDGSTVLGTNKVYEKVPCRLSYATAKSAEQSDNGSVDITQAIKLFIAPELNIKPGSNIIVTQNGRTAEYVSSGQSSLYETHQEVRLELQEKA